MKYYVILMVILMFLLSSCSAVNNVQETFDSNLIVKVAVAEVLYKNPAWKSEVNKITNTLLATDESNSSFALLEEQTKMEIDKLDVSPGTKVLAYELLTGISAGIQADLKQRGIINRKQQIVQVFDFIRWLEAYTR